MKLILPKTLPSASYDHLPLFFLAGPIKGGGDWQHIAALKLDQLCPDDCLIANPCRYTKEHPLWVHRVIGTENHFPRQLPWERHYMALAADPKVHGCLVFWLPAESKTHPRDDGQPYARDSYGELGMWRTLLRFNPNLHVAIGAEKDFPGLDVIERNFEEDVPGFRIHRSLDATLEAAVKLSTQTRRR